MPQAGPVRNRGRATAALTIQVVQFVSGKPWTTSVGIAIPSASQRFTVVLSRGQPGNRAGRKVDRLAKNLPRPAFVEDGNTAIGQSDRIQVTRRTGIQDALDGPGFAFVIAETDGQFFADKAVP